MLIREMIVNQGFTRKICPKCGGNIFIDKDIYSWYEECLQCGKKYDLPEVVEFLKQKNEGETQLADVSKS